MRMKRRFGCWLLLPVLTFFGCSGANVAAPATATVIIPTLAQLPSPTATQAITVVPSVTPSVGSMPEVDPVLLSISAAQSALAADGRSTTAVTVSVQASAQWLDAVKGLMVYFHAQGGGSFEPASIPLNNNVAATTYVAGFSPGITDVEIVANIDVPSLGRIIGTTNIQLVRQELQLQLPSVYVVEAKTAPVPLAFTLKANNNTLTGNYHATVTVDQGNLSTSPQPSGQASVDILLQSDQQTAVYFSPPTDVPRGTTKLCIRVIDRDNLGLNCRNIVWGGPIYSLTTSGFTRFATVGAGEPYISLVPMLDANSLGTYAALCYDIVSAPVAYDMSAYLINYRDKSPFAPGTCQPFEIGWGGYNFAFLSPTTPAFLRWLLVAPNFQFEAFTVIGSRALSWVDRSAPILLSSGGSLSLLANAPNFNLYMLTPYYQDAPTQEVWARIYLPLEHVDLATGQLILPADGLTLPAYTNISNAPMNINLNLQPSSPRLEYISPHIIHGNDSQAGTELQFVSVVVRGTISTAAVAFK